MQKLDEYKSVLSYSRRAISSRIGATKNGEGECDEWYLVLKDETTISD